MAAGDAQTRIRNARRLRRIWTSAHASTTLPRHAHPDRRRSSLLRRRGRQARARRAAHARAPTLLLLHGGPGFDHSIVQAARSRRSPTSPSSSTSTTAATAAAIAGTPERWNLAQWGDDVRAFCDALGIERPVVLGKSFGGMVAMAYATRHPEHPGKLVLVEHHARDAPRPRARGLRAARRRPRRARRRARYWENPGPTRCPTTRASASRSTNARPRDPDANARTLWNFDVMFDFGGGEDRPSICCPTSRSVRCPTLVLGGEDDPITPDRRPGRHRRGAAGAAGALRALRRAAATASSATRRSARSQ